MNGPAPVPTGTTEPVSIAEAVRLVLVAIVAAGWCVIPASTVNVIVDTVAVLVSIAGSVLARRRVVPLAKLDQA